jgi:ribosomal protein S27AE
MEAESGSWRLRLREYLAQSVRDDNPITVGNVIDAIAQMIPLHTASRKWAARGNEDFPPAHRMRAYMLTQEMHWLKCSFDPPGRKAWDTKVIVRSRFCPVCGDVFVAEPKARTCGAKCGSKLRRLVVP